jgi:crotonobetainyl-CoA:carnitine CoA-transferase CaiB-like acyl-CoA transferase
VLTTRPARDWARELNAIGVPAGAVLTVPEIAAHAAGRRGRGILARFDDVPGVGRDMSSVVRDGLPLDGAAQSVDAPPPELGAGQRGDLRRARPVDEEIDASGAEGAI